MKILISLLAPLFVGSYAQAAINISFIQTSPDSTTVVASASNLDLSSFSFIDVFEDFSEQAISSQDTNGLQRLYFVLGDGYIDGVDTRNVTGSLDVDIFLPEITVDLEAVDNSFGSFGVRFDDESTADFFFPLEYDSRDFSITYRAPLGLASILTLGEADPGGFLFDATSDQFDITYTVSVIPESSSYHFFVGIIGIVVLAIRKRKSASTR